MCLPCNNGQSVKNISKRPKGFKKSQIMGNSIFLKSFLSLKYHLLDLERWGRNFKWQILGNFVPKNVECVNIMQIQMRLPKKLEKCFKKFIVRYLCKLQCKIISDFLHKD